MRQTVQVFLGVLALAGFAFGVFVFKRSQSAVHEIEGLISFLIGAVGLAGFGVCTALGDVIERLPKPMRMPPPVPQQMQVPPQQMGGK